VILNINNFFNTLVKLSIFFPFVGIVPGIDIQPNFLLICLFSYIVLILLSFRTKIGLNSISIFLLCILLYTFRILFDSSDVELKYLLSYWVALFTPFLMWNLIFHKHLDTSRLFIYFVILSYTLIAILQIFIGKDFLGFLVTRPNEQFISLTSSYRGYRSLCPEPSKFGKIIIYLNILIFILTIYPKCTKKNFITLNLLTFFLFLINIFLSQSFYSVCFHTIVLIIFFYYINKKRLLSIILCIILFFILFYEILPDSRFSIILKALLDIDFKYIVSQGAFARLTNVFQSLYGGLHTLPFGFGGSDHQVVFISEIYSFAIGKRNLGGLVEHFLRFGIISIPFFIFLFLGFKRITKLQSVGNFHKIHIGFPLGLSLFILMLQDGSVADPLPWFIFFLLLKKSLCSTIRITDVNHTNE
jgi:hypothetical protein